MALFDGARARNLVVLRRIGRFRLDRFENEPDAAGTMIWVHAVVRAGLVERISRNLCASHLSQLLFRVGNAQIMAEDGERILFCVVRTNEFHVLSFRWQN